MTVNTINNMADNTVKLGQVIKVKGNPLAANTMLAEAVPVPSAQDEALVKVSSSMNIAFMQNANSIDHISRYHHNISIRKITHLWICRWH